MEKVLIVNDCKFESMILKDMLCDLDYDVEITNEFEAIRKVKEYSPDVVIANLIMKQTKGDILIQNIRIRYPQIRCILSSCNSLRLEDYVPEKVDGIIHTPVDKEALKAVLKAKKVSFCPYCGNKIDTLSGAHFCAYCGKKITS